MCSTASILSLYALVQRNVTSIAIPASLPRSTIASVGLYKRFILPNHDVRINSARASSTCTVTIEQRIPHRIGRSSTRTKCVVLAWMLVAIRDAWIDLSRAVHASRTGIAETFPCIFGGHAAGCVNSGIYVGWVARTRVTMVHLELAHNTVEYVDAGAEKTATRTEFGMRTGTVVLAWRASAFVDVCFACGTGGAGSTVTNKLVHSINAVAMHTWTADTFHYFNITVRSCFTMGTLTSSSRSAKTLGTIERVRKIITCSKYTWTARAFINIDIAVHTGHATSTLAVDTGTISTVVTKVLVIHVNTDSKQAWIRSTGIYFRLTSRSSPPIRTHTRVA